MSNLAAIWSLRMDAAELHHTAVALTTSIHLWPQPDFCCGCCILQYKFCKGINVFSHHLKVLLRGLLQPSRAAVWVPGVQKWLKAVGKEQGRKGKRLFMPMRIALTVRSRLKKTLCSPPRAPSYLVYFPGDVGAASNRFDCQFPLYCSCAVSTASKRASCLMYPSVCIPRVLCLDGDLRR